MSQLTPCSAVSSQAILAARKKSDHPGGFRSYGAAGQSVRICDQCGLRGVVVKGQMVKVQPKASPHAKTPLLLPENLAKAKAKGKAKAKADS